MLGKRIHHQNSQQIFIINLETKCWGFYNGFTYMVSIGLPFIFLIQLPHFYELCMTVIMNERVHKSFMICYTNVDELIRLYEML
jgi:hypothetical protein